LPVSPPVPPPEDDAEPLLPPGLERPPPPAMLDVMLLPPPLPPALLVVPLDPPDWLADFPADDPPDAPLDEPPDELLRAEPEAPPESVLPPIAVCLAGEPASLLQENSGTKNESMAAIVEIRGDVMEHLSSTSAGQRVPWPTFPSGAFDGNG